jgi:hypothetical protein
MNHIHHIIPKHMGGSDDPTNLIELSVEEHAMAHYKLYEQYGKKEDLCAYYMLSGKNQDPEFVKLRSSIGGTASYNRRKELGTDHLPFFGAAFTDDEKLQIASLGGKVQGKINAENGHMRKVQKLSNPSEAGKKGGAATIASGKGAFGDPIQRLESCRKGGYAQGKINAQTGHLKRISALSKRSTGKIWLTNGITNMMIDPTEIIPEGFRKGKTQKKGGVSVTRYPVQN